MGKIITEGLPIDMGLAKITSLGAPVAADDAARLQDVQTGSVNAVVNIAGVMATDIAPLGDGALRFVNTVRDFFRLEKTSTLTADGITVLTASGGTGRWIRLNIPDLYWNGQTTWYWDPVSGNDENNGATSGTGFKTHEELFRRTRGMEFSANVVVNIVSNIPNQVFRIGYYAPTIYYQAPLVSIGTGTLTTVVDLNKAENQTWDIVDTAIPTSWTASNYIDKLLVAKSGSSVVGTAWVDKDLGSKTARMAAVTIIEPVIVAGSSTAVNLFNDTAGSFTTGNTYTVYDMKTCAIEKAVLNLYNVVVYGLNFTSASSTNWEMQEATGQFLVCHCKFSASGCDLIGNIGSYQTLFTGQMTIKKNSSSMSNASFHDACEVSLSKNIYFINNVYLTNGGSLRITNGTNGSNVDLCADVAIFDLPLGSAGLTVDNQSIYQVGLIWGTDNPSTTWLVGIGEVGSWLYVTQEPIAVSDGTDIRFDGVDYDFTDLGIGLVSSRNSGILIGAV